jgi:hypothetical protein
MQSARHFAAATNGGGVRVSDANSRSKMGSGDVTNSRRCPAIEAAICGKLKAIQIRVRDAKKLQWNNLPLNENSSGLQSSLLY